MDNRKGHNLKLTGHSNQARGNILQKYNSLAIEPTSKDGQHCPRGDACWICNTFRSLISLQWKNNSGSYYSCFRERCMLSILAWINFDSRLESTPPSE
ncbi:hypothetical protein YC2023_122451 [Brassica napus]